MIEIWLSVFWVVTALSMLGVGIKAIQLRDRLIAVLMLSMAGAGAAMSVLWLLV